MHERFRFKTKESLIDKALELGLDLPFSDDLSPLFMPLRLEGFTVGNRFLVQPMEGYDSENNGSPSELTIRRYLRYASGGSSVIWYEAVSVNQNGRSNPRQLWIHGKNYESFSRLNDMIRKDAGKLGIDPLLVIQLTHSGRYSKPEGIARPQVAAPNPLLDRTTPYILTDDDLKRLLDQFVSAAKMAYKSGFNAVDLKACHGYLIVELLSAKERKNSIFGGEDTSGRFRFLLEAYDRIRYEVPDIMVTTRLNISDVYKGGFGVDKNGLPDFEEPLTLVEQLRTRGMSILNITMGSPYFNPHVNRPFDNPVPGQDVPDEHPLEGVMRILNGTSIFSARFKDLAVVVSALSYLRQFAPNTGAELVRTGSASLIGFGRNSFAYPSMPNELITKGKADPEKTCITCSGCTRLIRNLRPGGCVIRDREIYGEELKKLNSDGK